MKKANLGLVRVINYNLIWDYFLSNNLSTIPAVSEAIGLSLPTVTRAVEFGIELGLINVADIADSTGGRKARQYRLNQDYKHFLLMILDNEKVYFEVRDFAGNILKKDSVIVTYENILSDFENIIRTMKDEFKVIGSVSISITGVIDNGIVVDCWEIRHLNGFNLKEHLENEFNIDVIVENNVKAVTSAVKKYDSNYKQKTIVAATYGHNGFGFGFLIDGKVLMGAKSASGEISYAPSEISSVERPQHYYQNFMQTIIAILNPHVIVFYCGDKNIASKEMLERVKSSIPAYLVPIFVMGESYTKDSFEGLNMLCVENEKEKIKK